MKTHDHEINVVFPIILFIFISNITYLSTNYYIFIFHHQTTLPVPRAEAGKESGEDYLIAPRGNTQSERK